jgi:hypothetical protein
MKRICMSCHSVLGYSSVDPTTTGKVSHGLCPECARKMRVQMLKDLKE